MNLLTDLLMLNGVRHSCIISKSTLVASNFPMILNDSLINSSRIIKHMVDASRPLEQGHNEVQIEMNDSRLLGFPLDEDTLLLLMTELTINQALISTTVRSAMKSLLALTHSTPSSVTSPLNLQARDNQEHATKKAAPESESLKPTLKHIIRLLSEQVGPAAQILFKREYVIWTNEGEESSYRLPLLTSRIASFIEHPDKRSHFLLGTSDLISVAPTPITEFSNAIY